MRTKTFVTTPTDIQRRWWVVDAENQTLGRLAARIAPILRGKHKPIYTPNLDTGDYVIIINAEKIRVTGNRLTDKQYFHYSGYPGGIKSITLKDQLAKHPERVLESAIRGMLPKGPLGRAMFKKLKIYAGGAHPHQAQNPEVLGLEVR